MFLKLLFSNDSPIFEVNLGFECLVVMRGTDTIVSGGRRLHGAEWHLWFLGATAPSVYMFTPFH